MRRYITILLNRQRTLRSIATKEFIWQSELIRTCPKCNFSLTIDLRNSKYKGQESAEKSAWNAAMEEFGVKHQ